MNQKQQLEPKDQKKLPAKLVPLGQNQQNPKDKKQPTSAAHSQPMQLRAAAAVMPQAAATPYVMPAQLQAALDAVWQKSLPLLQQRVGVLDEALAATKAGHLNPELRSAAALEAHRLAGLLGTFGHPHGTDAARMLEIVFDSEAILTPKLAESLTPAMVTLRNIMGK